MSAFTQSGTATVRMRLPFPCRSAITQRPSCCCTSAMSITASSRRRRAQRPVGLASRSPASLLTCCDQARAGDPSPGLALTNCPICSPAQPRLAISDRLLASSAPKSPSGRASEKLYIAASTERFAVSSWGLLDPLQVRFPHPLNRFRSEHRCQAPLAPVCLWPGHCGQQEP